MRNSVLDTSKPARSALSDPGQGMTPDQISARGAFAGNGAPGGRTNPFIPRSLCEYDAIRKGLWFIDQDGELVQKQ